MLRATLIRASESAALRRLVTQRRLPRALALRFVAGETLDEGLAAARRLARAGRTVTLDFLGESVTDPSQARAACEVVVAALERIGAEGLPAGVSVKPTQMGLGLRDDPDLVCTSDAGRLSLEGRSCGPDGLARELLGRIAKAADAIGAHVTLDMEDSEVTEATIGLVEELVAAGHRNVGCALQSYLHRTRADVRRLSALGASLRLCKGTYVEPPSIAYQARFQVDQSYDDCAAYLLEHGTYPRLATHDHRLIRRAQEHAARLGVGKDRYEFQMLYGVRTALQDELVREGYRLCIYVPFGDQWYPYFMRRLAERPANLVFFLRALRSG